MGIDASLGAAATGGEAGLDSLLLGLRAVAEPTRLRLLVLCAHGELTVTELTQILGQSQPRVSRHLKLLCEAGLLERFREGTHAFYTLSRQGEVARLGELLVDLMPAGDRGLALDLERLEATKQTRDAAAAKYFRENAARWDSIRSLYIDETRGRGGPARGPAVGRLARFRRRGYRDGSDSRARGAARGARRGHRSLARDAGGGARVTSRAGGLAQCERAPRRHVPAAVAGGLLRCGHPAPGAALRRRSRRRDRGSGAHPAPRRHAGDRRFCPARARVSAHAACPPPPGSARCRHAAMVSLGRPHAAEPLRAAGRSPHRDDLDGAAPWARRKGARRPRARSADVAAFSGRPRACPFPSPYPGAPSGSPSSSFRPRARRWSASSGMRSSGSSRSARASSRSPMVRAARRARAPTRRCGASATRPRSSPRHI